MRRGPAMRREEQRRERERRGERAFLFGPDDRYLGEVGGDTWSWAISFTGGNVAGAARRRPTTYFLPAIATFARSWIWRQPPRISSNGFSASRRSPSSTIRW
jgi:hypothetical protein